MGARAGERDLVDRQGIGLNQLELAREIMLEFGQRRQAASITLDRDHRSAGIEQGARQPTGAGADLINPLPGKIAGDRSNPGQELAVENEVLAKRLACAEAVAGNDLSKGLGSSAGSSGVRRARSRLPPPSGSRLPSGAGRRGPAGNVEGGAVIGRGADDWQAKRQIDRGFEMQRLDRDQRLVVIHAQRSIVIGAGRGVEHGVGGVGAAHSPAFCSECGNGRRDDLHLLGAKAPAFARMRVEPGNGQAGLGDPEVALKPRRAARPRDSISPAFNACATCANGR